jgi:chemotaxis protein CheC
MSGRSSCWYELAPEPELEDLVSTAMQGAARNLSAMVGSSVEIHTQQVLTGPLCQISEHVGGPEAETVGVHLWIEGDQRGQAMLTFTRSSALSLVDLLVGLPLGTTSSFGDMERAALGEIGNMVLSGFLNDLVAVTGGELRPSPPALMIDVVRVIVSRIGSAVGSESDDLLIIDAAFGDAERTVQARLWVFPGPARELAGEVCAHR